MDLFERQGFALVELPRRDRDFAVRAVRMVGVRDDRILAAIADRHEFVRHLAAHHAGVRLDRQHVLHAEPAEDPHISFVAADIVFLKIRLVGVEAVGVLHREFADPDQPGARTRLVAVFGLDLVKHDRQLLVTVDLGADKMGDALFMGHRKQHRLVVAVLETQQLRTDRFIAARLLPELGGQHDRHQDLLAVDAVHLFADDLLDLRDDPLADRQQRIDPGGDRADIAAADQEFVTDRLGVFRIFLDPAPHQLTHSHIVLSFRKVVSFLTPPRARAPSGTFRRRARTATNALPRTCAPSAAGRRRSRKP